MTGKDFAVFMVSCIVIFTICFFVILYSGKKLEDAKKAELLTAEESGKNSIRQEAVSIGVARWTADNEGKPKFEWLVPTEKTP